MLPSALAGSPEEGNRRFDGKFEPGSSAVGGDSSGQSGMEFRNICVGSATSRRTAGRTLVRRNPCVSRRIGPNGDVVVLGEARAVLEDTPSISKHRQSLDPSYSTLLVCFVGGPGKSGPADAASADAACLQPSQSFGSAGGIGYSCQVSIARAARKVSASDVPCCRAGPDRCSPQQLQSRGQADAVNALGFPAGACLGESLEGPCVHAGKHVKISQEAAEFV